MYKMVSPKRKYWYPESFTTLQHKTQLIENKRLKNQLSLRIIRHVQNTKKNITQRKYPLQ